MKRFLKSSLSLILAIAIIFSSFLVGVGKVDIGRCFEVEVNAATTIDNATFLTKLNNAKSRFRQGEYFTGNDGTGKNLTQTTATLKCT